MKKFFLIRSFFLVSTFALTSLITSAQELDRECVNGNSTAQDLISEKVALFEQLKSQIESNVEALILQEGITNSGGVLSFENLASVMSVANQLEDYDKQYADAYAEYCNDIVEGMWNASVCNYGFTLGVYTEEVFNYLEEEKFTVIDEFASTVFAQKLSFRSALLKINAEEEDWLVSVGEDFTSDNPAFNQDFENELYWPVLSEDWNIELRNPEPELSDLTGYARTKPFLNKKIYRPVFSGPYEDGYYEDYDAIEVILFILENWNEIEAVLNWILEQVATDCHPSVSTNADKDWRLVPSQLSPDKERKIYYGVRQKGVFGDFKATLTKIEGKVKLYKKKNNRFKKDHNNIVGIGYCTLQWNPCDDEPWPANNNPHVYAGRHEHKKAKFKHKHPYALTIHNSGDFLTYYLYYNHQFTGDKIYTLGPNVSCE